MLIEFKTRFQKIKKWRMLQSYRYINHVREQNPSLLITKNQNTANSKGTKSNSDWPDTSADVSWKGSSSKSKLGKSSYDEF